jgi:hypothetical protein
MRVPTLPATLPYAALQGHANSQLTQPLADRVGSHSKDAGNRKHGAHHAQHSQRQRRHTGGKQRVVNFLGPALEREEHWAIADLVGKGRPRSNSGSGLGEN